MKKICYILGLIAAISACSLIEEPTFINQSRFYKTEAQCRAVVNGVYIPIQSIYSSTMWLVMECQTDLFYNTSTTQDASLQVTPAKPEHGATVWRYAYRGVDLCNEAIHCIGDSPYISDSLKHVMTAECRVMRAMYYYCLTNMFNGVPFYTAQVNTYAVQDSIRYLPRTDANEIRRFLYRDLRDNALPYFTEANGLKCRACDAPYKRSGYAHALMLMAKFAMWYGDYAEAIAALTQLEEVYGDFTEARYPLDDIRWSKKHVPETIFEIQHEYDVAGVKYYGSLAKIMMPPHSSGYVFDGVTMYGYGNTIPAANSTRANLRFGGYRTTASGTESATTASSLFGPLPMMADQYDASISRYTVKMDMDAIRTGIVRGEKLDHRAIYKFGMCNLETGDIFDEARKNGRCWAGIQFWCPNIINNYDSNNYRLFRYADAVLMLAECWCAVQNSLKSLSYLNKIRRRAGVDDVTSFSGYEDLMLAIRNERARELGGEGHRKWDLVRWGVWFDQTYNNTTYDALKNNMRPWHEYYPIPDNQCSLSKYILDNPEYKQEY
ncbi:MAG: RagB/SusD family nutrient uptake outer membrane protein [Bacteroidales bacterium]|nr:RagB/SusD family nutrient uptake outer membrane protein [Bacteroidales bacterium]